MFQDQATIRTKILKTLNDLGRSATISELNAGVWYRGRIDGTRDEVGRIVDAEVKRMGFEGILGIDESARHEHFGANYWKITCPLTAMSIIAD